MTDLISWLRKQRDAAAETKREYEDQGDEYEMAVEQGRAEAYQEVLLHIQFGDAT